MAESLFKWLWKETHVLKAVVRIPAPHTGWTFFTLICCKIYNVCLKRTKKKRKEAGNGSLNKKCRK